MFGLGRLFKPSIMLDSEGTAFQVAHLKELPSWVGSCPYPQTSDSAGMERLTRDKQSSLLDTFVVKSLIASAFSVKDINLFSFVTDAPFNIG